MKWALPGHLPTLAQRRHGRRRWPRTRAFPRRSTTQLKLDALARFRGVKRRQELLVDTTGLKVIEDFGHHPTALAATLQSFRARFPGHVIHAAFEPRSNTSRTKVMQAAFMRALALADEVYLGAVANPEKFKPEERFDADAVIQFLETQGVHGYTAATNAGAAGHSRRHRRKRSPRGARVAARGVLHQRLLRRDYPAVS